MEIFVYFLHLHVKMHLRLESPFKLKSLTSIYATVLLKTDTVFRQTGIATSGIILLCLELLIDFQRHCSVVSSEIIS